MNLIKKGSTDVTRYVMLVDSTAGTPETGYTITSLDLQYTRNRTAPAAKVDATALAATDSAHGDNQAIQIDATSSPGLYRVDWPDAAFATGVDKVVLVVSGTGLAPAVEEIQLVDFDPADGVRLGLTALPNAAADAAGGLPISDAGGLDLDARLDAAITSRLAPTTAGRTLDVSAGGEAGIDWANVGSPTTTVGLSGTTVKTATDVETDTADIQTRLPAALVSGRIDASVGAMAANVVTASAVADGAIDAGAIAADAITAAKLAADVTTELQSGLATAANLATLQTNVDDLPTNDELATALGTADDAVLTAIAGLNNITAASVWSVATRTLTAGTNIVLAKGTGVTGFNDLSAGDVRTAVGLAAADLDTQLTACKGTTQITESYAANGIAPTRDQAMMAVHQMLMQFVIAGTSWTVKKLDGSTTAFVVTIDDDVAPAALSRD